MAGTNPSSTQAPRRAPCRWQPLDSPNSRTGAGEDVAGRASASDGALMRGHVFTKCRPVTASQKMAEGVLIYKGIRAKDFPQFTPWRFWYTEDSSSVRAIQVPGFGTARNGYCGL